jgi:transcriptional regulator with XRE-family HTH domain
MTSTSSTILGRRKEEEGEHTTMTKPLDQTRLKELRRLRKLSQKALAHNAKLSKETIHRLEKGRQPGNRQSTVEALAKALEVAPGVLTGELPMPVSTAEEPGVAGIGQYQISVRMNGAVRNAFFLAARRYEVPIARIVELAPYLFVLAAEASLKRRRTKLDELEALFDREDELRNSFPHLPRNLVPNFEAIDPLTAERESIDARDILASKLPDNIFERFSPIQDQYSQPGHNPFLLHLQEAGQKTVGITSIELFDRDSTRFTVCRDEVIKIAGGDENLAERIMWGWAILHEMPRELLAEDAEQARIAWLRERVQEEEEKVREEEIRSYKRLVELL